MEPIRVTVRRGETVESVHRVHAVAVDGGQIVASAGDPHLITFMRSSAKPLQALPLVRSRDDLSDRDVAIASASHLADAAQLEAVRSLLAKAHARESELECGPAGVPPARIKHNCSGKHAGMLALCAARNWPTEGYRLSDHPAQRAMLTELAAAASLPAERIGCAVDGCGVVTFALALESIANAFSRLGELDGGARVIAAMRAHPLLIRGEGASDTRLMQTLPGWIAKGGAEGLLCARTDAGLGIGVKVEDGNARALEPALARFCGRLGVELESFGRKPVSNSRGEVVGCVEAS